MKILFVDDDAIARRGIVSKLDWKAWGWELIYAARDAMDALDYMSREQPDVILSDIKMPVMDGIQMALIARNYYPDIKYIFLSGYKEFEYAKQALKLNAVDYLNKPVDSAQLIQVLKEAQALVEKDKNANAILKDKYPFICRHYLSQMMQNHFREIDDSVFKAFDLNLSNGFGMAGFLDFKDTDPDIFSLPAKNALDQLCAALSQEFHGSIFMTTETMQIFFVFTCSELDQEEEFRVRLTDLETCVKDLLRKNAPWFPQPFFHYGTVIRSLNELYRSYESILRSIDCDTNLLLNQIKAYLEQNYGQEDLTLTKIAEHFYVNHCYLTSIFKDHFGINLYDYLIQTRMKKAAELILSTNKKVYEIAEAVGYKNSQYFSVSFKKYFNSTVMEYKKLHTRQSNFPLQAAAPQTHSATEQRDT